MDAVIDWLKKYWWVVLLLPVLAYFGWKYYQARAKNASVLSKARDVKAEKKILNSSSDVVPSEN